MTQNNPANLKVKAGDPLSAKLWNRTIDRIAAGRNGYGGAIDLYGQSLIPYRVESTGGVEMGDLITINGFDGHEDNENPHDLGAQLAFVGKTPIWTSSITRVAVAAEPAKKGEQVFACISGLALVKVKQQFPDKRFVQVDPDDPKQARQATGGFAKVLFEYGQDWCLVDMGERQNIWVYELRENVDEGASTAQIKLKEMTGEIYTDFMSMKFEPAVECELKAGDTGLCVQCGNEFFALTSCSSFLGCPTSANVLLYEQGASPKWSACNLAGKNQTVKVFCGGVESAWSITSPTEQKQVATSISCAVKECGECTWRYNETPVPSYSKIASCSFECGCAEPVIADPIDQSLYRTKCYGADGSIGELCFTLLLESATVWACGDGTTSTDECCVPIFPPQDCPDPCEIP